MLAQEGIEAVKNIRDTGFRNLTIGNHGISLDQNQWVLSGAEDTIDIYTRVINISQIDHNIKRITSTVSWSGVRGTLESTSLSLYLTNWHASYWYDFTAAHFNSGSIDNTVVTSTGDGEVRLGTTTYADWCNPSIFITKFNLSGSGVATAITAIPGQLFLGTG